MEVIECASEVNWFYKAANYYDKAIACSRPYLAALSGDTTKPSSPYAPPSPLTGNSDDLLAAVSIFSLYESLDNMELGMVGWFQYHIHYCSMRRSYADLDGQASYWAEDSTYNYEREAAQ